MHPAAIRKLLAEIIAESKAYEVPNICSSIGLAAGDEQEAFSSKFRYAKKRLDAIGPSDLNDCASRLNTIVESDALSAFLAGTSKKSLRRTTFTLFRYQLCKLTFCLAGGVAPLSAATTTQKGRLLLQERYLKIHAKS